METWKPIPDLIGYEASDEGRIRRHGRLLKGSKSYKSSDYQRIRLDRFSGRRRVNVHALVARAFIGQIPAGHVHNHKDGNKQNNRPENIEFVTQSDNNKHAYAVLKRPHNSGSKHGMAKLTEAEVTWIRILCARGLTRAYLARMFQVSIPSVSMIVSRKTWRHV